jgi:gluconokinase
MPAPPSPTSPSPVGSPLVTVMGVSGSGKTTVGAALAQRLGVPFADADDFHPAANVAKMSAGTPLDDLDRLPWLQTMSLWLADHAATGAVISCSALKHWYRTILREAAPTQIFVHLDGSPEVVSQRVAGRPGHFMPASLVDSQFATLERLRDDETGVTLPLDLPVDTLVDRAAAAIAEITTSASGPARTGTAAPSTAAPSTAAGKE